MMSMSYISTGTWVTQVETFGKTHETYTSDLCISLYVNYISIKKQFIAVWEDWKLRYKSEVVSYYFVCFSFVIVSFQGFFVLKHISLLVRALWPQPSDPLVSSPSVLLPQNTHVLLCPLSKRALAWFLQLMRPLKGLDLFCLNVSVYIVRQNRQEQGPRGVMESLFFFCKLGINSTTLSELNQPAQVDVSLCSAHRGARKHDSWGPGCLSCGLCTAGAAATLV